MLSVPACVCIVTSLDVALYCKLITWQKPLERLNNRAGHVSGLTIIAQDWLLLSSVDATASTWFYMYIKQSPILLMQGSAPVQSNVHSASYQVTCTCRLCHMQALLPAVMCCAHSHLICRHKAHASWLGKQRSRASPSATRVKQPAARGISSGIRCFTCMSVRTMKMPLYVLQANNQQSWTEAKLALHFHRVS